MSRFQPGDIAVIRHLDDIQPEFRGRECLVLTNLVHVKGITGARYRIELQGFDPRYRVYAMPHVLRPLPEPDLPGSWAECVFKPKGVEA